MMKAQIVNWVFFVIALCIICSTILFFQHASHQYTWEREIACNTKSMHWSETWNRCESK